jgi:hypothetical protein
MNEFGNFYVTTKRKINTWCKYFYYILDHYEFVKLGRVMRDHFRILGNRK